MYEWSKCGLTFQEWGVSHILESVYRGSANPQRCHLDGTDIDKHRGYHAARRLIRFMIFVVVVVVIK